MIETLAETYFEQKTMRANCQMCDMVKIICSTMGCRALQHMLVKSLNSAFVHVMFYFHSLSSFLQHLGIFLMEI